VHESALARQLVSAVLERLPPGARVRRVHGWLAETESLSADSLGLHFAHLAAGTAAEGAQLDLTLTHVRARCGSCGTVYLPEHHVTICPDCGHLEAELLDRVGMGVASLVVDGP